MINGLMGLHPLGIGVERHDVRHVCPECGGAQHSQHGSTTLVLQCWACSDGTLSNDELDRYLAELERRASEAAR
jgi:hypothetical protein